jgi:hypothetical protein
MKGRCGASPTGIFPFRFAGQAVLAACVLREPLAKLHGIIPIHMLYGMVLSLKAGWIGL